jgi:hypothetical protein
MAAFAEVVADADPFVGEEAIILDQDQLVERRVDVACDGTGNVRVDPRRLEVIDAGDLG